MIISPLKRIWSFIWIKIEFLPSKNDLYTVWLKRICWFWSSPIF
jgi:hypothetical protein